MKYLLLICLIYFIRIIPGNCQDQYPHIFVMDQDKDLVLAKIDGQDWAQKIYQDMEDEVKTYVDRHQDNPEWILSRYQMNWKKGAHYTRFYSEPSGTQLNKMEGNAPYPTVRVTTHKRNPVAPDGYYYRAPDLEEVIPYDTASQWRLQSSGPEGEWSYTEPRQFVGAINGHINDLALESAIIYWLTGEKKYARFAADILFQWARGAYYQEPVEGACRNGFLDIQSLGDRRYDELVLAYDFVREFMASQDYETKYFQPVFEKMANTAMIRGFWNNNWYAAQSTTMTYAALSLDDSRLKNYYLSYFLERDTINGSCGQLGLPTTTETHLTHDGHWKENPGYHNMPVGDLLKSAMAVENNGFQVFKEFPALFQASYALLKYSFPNLRIMGFGDIGSRRTQSPINLEIAIRYAAQYDDPALPALVEGLQKLIDQGLYQRENTGWLGLLTFLPKLPTNISSTFTWDRGMEIDFARCFGQRNGTDPVDGLMYYVQGATYNHNNANGMAMELYGEGYVLGSESGTTSYEEPVFVNYYAVFAAHNTVIAAGASEPNRPFTGGGGAKAMGEINLSAMEPRADANPVSPYVSFTETNYLEPSTYTSQQRTMALIRTSETSGYYVDIFRSDNTISNDYLYHNLGHEVVLLDSGRKTLATTPAKLFYRKERQTGLDWLQNIETPSIEPGQAIVRFDLQQKGKDVHMQVFTPLEPGEKLYSAFGPRTRIAPKALYDQPTPAMIIHRPGSAWDQPFTTVFEPYKGKKGYHISQVKKINTGSSLSATTVKSEDGKQQLILQSDQPEFASKGDNFSLKGHFAVVSHQKGMPEYLYLGKGGNLSWNGFTIESEDAENAVFLEFNDSKLMVSSHASFLLTVPYTLKQVLDSEGKKLQIEGDQNRTIIRFEPGNNKIFETGK